MYYVYWCFSTCMPGQCAHFPNGQSTWQTEDEAAHCHMSAFRTAGLYVAISADKHAQEIMMDHTCITQLGPLGART